MKNKKNLKTLLLSLLGVLIIGGIIILILLLNKNSNEYSFNEKKWISKNTSHVIDIYINDSLPVFAYNGEGVLLDYLNALETDTGLKFNINYSTETDYNFVNKNTINNGQLVFFKDHYVALSSKLTIIDNIKNLSGKMIGVLSSDMSNVTTYLNEISNINIKTYDNYETLYQALESDDIALVIVPLYKNLDTILIRNLNIEFHFDDLRSYYLFETKIKDMTLSEIMRKFYNRWIEKFSEKRNEHLSNLYYEIKEYSELSKDSILSDDYIVGYVQNLPYEGKINNTFAGLTKSYLDKFSDLTGATYKYVKYNSVEKLNQALINKKIDIIANYYGLSNTSYSTTAKTESKDYVVLAHYSNEVVINSFNSITNKNISMLNNLNLTKMIASKDNTKVLTYENIKSLVKKSDESALVVIDKSTYDYYKSKELKNYSIRFIGSYPNAFNFLLLSKNTDFNNFYDFFVKMSSSKELEYNGIDETIKVLKSNIVLSFIINNIFYIIVVVFILGFIIYKAADRVRISKKIKREDKLMYLDVMTNLKNRNYLNDNLRYWEENKIYPQTIVVVDLNKVKELNDKEGHEAGDKQIKAAASALIKTQRDNSEIIRTDGNEFLVYLVGYEEKYIVSYIHRLNREFKTSLPYKEHGVAVGYSMISDELKTIDDAINEALIMMRDNKVNKNE